MNSLRVGDIVIGVSIIPFPPFIIPGVGTIITPSTPMHYTEFLPQAGTGLSMAIFPLGIGTLIGLGFMELNMTPIGKSGSMVVGQSMGTTIAFSLMSYSLA